MTATASAPTRLLLARDARHAESAALDDLAEAAAPSPPVQPSTASPSGPIHALEGLLLAPGAVAPFVFQALVGLVGTGRQLSKANIVS